jgi:hypothetical protein
MSTRPRELWHLLLLIFAGCHFVFELSNVTVLPFFISAIQSRGVTVPNVAAREVPRDPICRAHPQQRPTNVDRYQRSLMPRTPQPPPEESESETHGCRRSLAGGGCQYRRMPTLSAGRSGVFIG